jgi:tRNA-dihydrouridine synthase
VQIAGTDAAMMADAAHNIERGAQIIDINMGCPAKKVCDRWAGSALMRTRRWHWPSSRRWWRPARRRACPSR